MQHKIDSFSGEYRFLSNFYPFEFETEGGAFPTLEHLFQASKSLDPREQEYIRIQPTPGDAKRAGRRVSIRGDWDDARVSVMFLLLLRKFAPGTPLAERLLATGDAYLEEGNTWGDRFWGTVNGEGTNMLGICLMVVRESLKPGLKNALLDLGFACDDLTEALREQTGA